MKRFLLLSIIGMISTGSAWASDTAYQALRLIGKERPAVSLNRVILVEGLKGTPQPAKWKIVMDDPAARAGVREFIVENSKIISERTPVHVYSGSSTEVIMDFQKLNLDSAGAFTLAEAQAKKEKVGFDAVDYLLQADEGGKSPVWILKLLDPKGRNLGTLRISADTGAILQETGMQASSGDSSQVAVVNPSSSTSETEDSENKDGVGHKIKKGLIDTGRTLKHFFTGFHHDDETKPAPAPPETVPQPD